MNLDYIEISPTPVDEDCAQVGEPNFRENATKEMNAFINQLYRAFPLAEDKSVSFRKKWFSHDFGSYGYVVAYYDADSSESYEYAISVENDTPMYWDDEALQELEQ
jgi:hypothetical protein